MYHSSNPLGGGAGAGGGGGGTSSQSRPESSHGGSVRGATPPSPPRTRSSFQQQRQQQQPQQQRNAGAQSYQSEREGRTRTSMNNTDAGASGGINENDNTGNQKNPDGIPAEILHRQTQPWETSRGQPPGFGGMMGGDDGDNGAQSGFPGLADRGALSGGGGGAGGGNGGQQQYRDPNEGSGPRYQEPSNWMPTFSSMGNSQSIGSAGQAGGGATGPQQQQQQQQMSHLNQTSYSAGPNTFSQYGRLAPSPAYTYHTYPPALAMGQGYNQSTIYGNPPMSDQQQVPIGFTTGTQSMQPQLYAGQQQEDAYGGTMDNRTSANSSSSSSVLRRQQQQQQQTTYPSSMRHSPAAQDYSGPSYTTMHPSQANVSHNMNRRQDSSQGQDGHARSPASSGPVSGRDFGSGLQSSSSADRRRQSAYMDDDTDEMGTSASNASVNAGKKRKLNHTATGASSSSRPSRGLDSPSTMFQLIVRQQPERARLCSFKEENDTIDRRPVDPPPIVQIVGPSGQAVGHMLENTSFFVRVRLVASQPTEGQYNRSSSPSSSTWPEQRLPQGNEATTGEALQTPEKLRDLDGQEGAFCVFGRLSIRMPGLFRLRFVLYHTKENGIEEITSCLSDPFEVFSPKLFKGMKQSTPLTRHFASQGLKIKLRQDATSKPRKKKESSEDGPAESGNAQASTVFRVPEGPFGPPTSQGQYQQRQFAQQVVSAPGLGYNPMNSRSPQYSSQQLADRYPDDRMQGGGGGGQGGPMMGMQGPMSLPPITSAVPASVWFTNPSYGGREDPHSGPSYGSQGGVSFQQGIRHGGDDGMLPPMSFGRLPQQIYEGLIPTTPGGGGGGGGNGSTAPAGTGDLANFSLKNIVGSGPTLPPPTSGLQPMSTSNQNNKRLADDLHRLFDVAPPGPQRSDHGDHGGPNSRSPMPPARDINAMRFTLPPPKTKGAPDTGQDQYRTAQG